LIKDVTYLDDYEVINIYGGLLNFKDTHIILPYIKELFMSRIPNDIKVNVPTKIYTTRKQSAQFHQGFLRRHMLNENEFIDKCKDITYITLEDYSFKQKIQLFMNIDLIVSSNSSSFSFLPFCKKDVIIIEIINKGTRGFTFNHWTDMTNKLGYNNYNNYKNITEDKDGNYSIDVNQFYEYYITTFS
tara:strand:- start:485 stop:1045 length:561 start_codon:yes stop_codon:yes gene_type:complete